MRFTLIILLCLVIPFLGKAQQGEKQGGNTGPANLTFEIIVSLSAINTTENANAIKTLANSGTSGLTYLGFCKSQKTVLLIASSSGFLSKTAVINYLKSKIGECILDYKD